MLGIYHRSYLIIPAETLKFRFLFQWRLFLSRIAALRGEKKASTRKDVFRGQQGVFKTTSVRKRNTKSPASIEGWELSAFYAREQKRECL
jgi:hypothetical protein